MVNKAFCRLRVDRCEKRALRARGRFPTFVFPHPLQAQTSDFHKYKRLQDIHHRHPAVTQLALPLSTMMDAYHLLTIPWKGNWDVSFGSLSGVPPFQCHLRSSQSYPFSEIHSHVFWPVVPRYELFWPHVGTGASPQAGTVHPSTSTRGYSSWLWGMDAVRPIWCSHIHNPKV